MTDILEALEIMGFTTDSSGVLTIAAYVLQALALYTIAKRRCIGKPWLAWIPLMNLWILGSISDQYHYVNKREVKNKRKTLLGLGIAVAAMLFLVFVLLIWAAVEVILVAGGTLSEWMGMIGAGAFDDLSHVVDRVMIPLVLIALLALPLLVVSIMMIVQSWIATYDLFLSCEPANATVYLVVSIIGGFVVSGVNTIFMFICRNKDLGMPPRKTESAPVAEMPSEEPWVQE